MRIVEEYLSSPCGEGSRNARLFAAVMAAREQGWDEHDIKTHLAPKAIRDGLSPIETENTIRSALGRPITEKFMPHQGEGRALDWDEVIPAANLSEYQPLDLDWIEEAEITAPTDDSWNPAEQISTYLSTLFHPEEYVGLVMESADKDGRYIPANRGCYSQAAGELLADLKRYKGSVSKALGDYNADAGAWVRFNPLDGRGCRDENVTAFRYALIECDSEGLTPEKQAAIYERLELPIAIMVHSGKKSMHAIVRIEAESLEEYRERVNFLHQVCKKNGLEIDRANKNPSRLSRLPGIERAGAKQYIAGINLGKASWLEWHDYIEELNDSLPDIEPLDGIWNNMPDLAPPLIDGILRVGHKMLLAGPSKAGKSFMLLQLAVAIADGTDWMGWKVRKGKVLYVNLELDRPSCLHRLKTLYGEQQPRNLANIDVWNLRGKAQPLDKLAPKLIRRARKQQYTAIIVDPIYKVLTGDENSAHEMALFTNQFDMIASELQASVIFCHHHSKGEQGQKMSRDRASGSGVFSRDPDALLDLIELHLSEERRKAVSDRLTNEGCAPGETFSAWRIEGTIREFPPLKKTCFLFDYPRHYPDTFDLLTDAVAAGEVDRWSQSRSDKQEQKRSKSDQLEAAYHSAKGFGDDAEPFPRIGDMAEFCGITVATIKKWITETNKYVACKDGTVRTKEENQTFLLNEAIQKARDLTGNSTIKKVAELLNLAEKTARRHCQAAGHSIENGFILK